MENTKICYVILASVLKLSTLQIGMEGKGFEPTVDALFGENGFFPDTALRTMYFVSDNMPFRVNEILQNMLPALKREKMKTQVFREICFVNITCMNILSVIMRLNGDRFSNTIWTFTCIGLTEPHEGDWTQPQ